MFSIRKLGQDDETVYANYVSAILLAQDGETM